MPSRRAERSARRHRVKGGRGEWQRQTSLKKRRMVSRLPKVKAIGGARAATVRRNPFATDRTRTPSLRRSNTKPIHPRLSTFAAANTPLQSPPATARTAHSKRLVSALTSRSWLPLAPLLLLVLSGCGNFLDRGPKEPCPRISILSEAAQVTQFQEGPGRDLRDVRFQGKFGNIAVNCSVDDGNVVMQTSIEVIVAMGPAATERVGQFSFFVALTDPSEDILVKEVFVSPLEFQANQRRSGVVEQIEQRFSLKSGERAARYAILVGFQLSRDQLDYNRKSRGR